MRAQLIDSVPECRDLQRVSFVFSGQQQPAHAVGGLTTDGSAILWLGFAFESVSSLTCVCDKAEWLKKLWVRA